MILNLFYVKVLFLCSLKTSESLWFSDIFRGYGNETGIKLFETFLLQNGLKTKPNLPYQELYFSTGIFELPILPKGKELLINIKTTWGDRHYVGLNGIEVFSDAGNLVKVKHVSKTFKIQYF